MTENSEKVKVSAVDVLREVTAVLNNSESRPEQEQATNHVESAITNGKPLLLEAGTGTGKTLAYLTPLIMSGKRAVVSTATKQLSEQIIKKDMPFLAEAIKNSSSPNKSFSYALLKGRDNYFCWYKDSENSRLDVETGADMLSGGRNKIADEISQLKEWADDTKTGDRAEAPPIVSDKIWRQYSSNSVECVGKAICPFGSECFAEMAKDKARESDIVVTNHAVVAHDLASDMTSLGDRQIIVFDELHEVDRYMTDAWGAVLSPNMLKDTARTLKPVEDMVGLPVDEFSVSMELNKSAEVLQVALSQVEQGRIPTPSGSLKEILMGSRMRCFEAVTKIAEKLNDKKIPESFKQNLTTVRKKLESVIESVDLIMDDKETVVKWIAQSSSKDSPAAQLQAAPLHAGLKLQKYLQEHKLLMMGVSATIRVGGSFTIPMHNLGYQDQNDVTLFNVASPFDYKKQAMLYVPDSSFPAPVGAGRKDHTEAVKAVSFQLIQAMKGRAVVLTTTTFGVKEIGDYLRSKLPSFNIILQGDAPNSQIIEEFVKDEHSVLVGTMGLWHGLDLPGKTASLLIIDKIPFKPMNDPLLEARKEYVEAMNGDGFTEVFVAEASIMLTQGFGRLIRAKSDKGIVAILDNRLLTKNYGKILLKSLPPINMFSNREKVVSAAERLAVILDED